LLGTAWSWFSLDIAFYGLGLNSSIILGAIGFGAPSGAVADKIGRPAAVWLSLKNASIGNLIISTAGLIPGFYVTMAVIDHVSFLRTLFPNIDTVVDADRTLLVMQWGRKPIQYMGFAVLTAIFCAMGFGYDKMINHGHQAVFVVLYCLANFFQNFGPNTTTFIVPGEVFPTRYRCTGHGISAASGKLGAIIAQVGFSQLKDIGGPNQFVKHILQIFALFMLTGVFSTMLIPETKGRTLEELSNEDQNEYVRDIVNVPPFEYAATEISAPDASVATHGQTIKNR
jgi:PHS family inorganic phosphate transporter-like MFS transporter